MNESYSSNGVTNGFLPSGSETLSVSHPSSQTHVGSNYEGSGNMNFQYMNMVNEPSSGNMTLPPVPCLYSEQGTAQGPTFPGSHPAPAAPSASSCATRQTKASELGRKEDALTAANRTQPKVMKALDIRNERNLLYKRLVMLKLHEPMELPVTEMMEIIMTGSRYDVIMCLMRSHHLRKRVEQILACAQWIFIANNDYANGN